MGLVGRRVRWMLVERYLYEVDVGITKHDMMVVARSRRAGRALDCGRRNDTTMMPP